MNSAVASEIAGASSQLSSIKALPRLDDKQVGAIRHIKNLASQATNDWSGMMGLMPMQEDYGAYRYQLAYMAYALGLAHRHRLPAAPAYFKNSFDQLIQKMIHPEVWLYWRNASQGKGPLSYNAPKLDSEIDPVRRDNIMYSAYIQSMALMYHALFNDDKYGQDGALSFDFKPMLCLNDEQASFVYDEKSLNERVYWNMVESGYLGVACEPYCVFQICNQVPILGFRLHDWIYGGDTATEVTQGYAKAWAEFGGYFGDEGTYLTLVQTHDNAPMAIAEPWSDGWCGMLMNTWNGEIVRQRYAQQLKKWIAPGEEGALSVVMPKRVRPEGMSDTGLVEGLSGDFGWVACWVSEMGDQATLDGLLKHADRYMNPTWKEGGFFYPRNDECWDAEGHLTAVNPTTANALMAYARLNVNDGLKTLFEAPWDEGHFAQPLVSEVPDAIELRRAQYLPDARALVVTLDGKGQQRLGFDNIHGAWTLSLDGAVVGTGEGARIGDCKGVAITPTASGLNLELVADGEHTLVLECGA